MKRIAGSVNPKDRHREAMFERAIIALAMIGGFICIFLNNPAGEKILFMVLSWFGAKRYYRR